MYKSSDLVLINIFTSLRAVVEWYGGVVLGHCLDKYRVRRRWKEQCLNLVLLVMQMCSKHLSPSFIPFLVECLDFGGETDCFYILCVDLEGPSVWVMSITYAKISLNPSILCPVHLHIVNLCVGLTSERILKPWSSNGGSRILNRGLSGEKKKA